MTTRARLPYDVEPFSIDELVADCRCLDECTCLGVSMHRSYRLAGSPAQIEFTDCQVALLDGYGDYGD